LGGVKAVNAISDLRPSPIAGTWYEGEPRRLAAQMDAFLNAARLPADLTGEVVAVVAPHAGHIYSGRTAGHAFRAVVGQSFDLVVVISPLHRDYFSIPPDTERRRRYSAVLTTAHRAYATPLGTVTVDQPALEQFNRLLEESLQVGVLAVANDQEHSLEIELPFLQCALAEPFQLLPLMLRSRDAEMLHKVGLALAATLQGKRALLVASTDLSHFFPEQAARRLDEVMLEQFEAFSPSGVLLADEEQRGLACGAGAVAAVFWAAQGLGANAVKVVHYSTSADQTGDRSSVVGYGAAVVLRRDV
jgi:MEMO1 family protein